MKLKLFLWLALAVAIAALAGGPDSSPKIDAASGLVNEGFEDGVLDALPSGWVASTPEVGGVRVVDAEGPSEFPTYADMGNITVTPYSGSRMVRLGGDPKQVSQNQSQGAYSISQTFIPGDQALGFAFRLFSWEFRDSDSISFNLSSGAASVGTLAAPVVITMDNQQRSCSALPCTISVDAGKSGDFVDSGWTAVNINNVPGGAPLTITFAVTAAANESHATWAYFDSTRSPVASFSFSPPAPFEGETVQFEDHSDYPDAGAHAVGWSWEIDGQVLTSQHPLYIFPNEGTYVVRLTVTGSDESIATTASDVIVRNANPIVNALNTEALAGQAAPIVARFIDPGWLDAHTSGLTVGSTTAPGVVREDNNPAYGSGIAEGTASSLTSEPGVAAVLDHDGGTGSDPFSFTIVPDDPQRHEPNNVLAGAPALESDGSYLSYIQSQGDVDFYEILLPGNRPLPPGAEVLVTLRDLPADYDLALLSLDPAGGIDPGDSGVASFSTAPFTRSPFTRSPFTRSPFTRSPFTRSPFTRSPFTRSDFSFSELPLSQLAFTGLEGNEITGTDIGLGELGIDAISNPGVRIAGFSAGHGLAADAVLARTSVAGQRIFAAVVGANGEFESAPYRLQVEASVPLDLEALLGSAACSGTPLVGAADATSSTLTLFDGAGPATTLFVTQRERMRAAHGMDDVAWDAMLTDLTALAQHPSVGGDIISLPSSMYDSWDQSPCSIEAANAVTDQIESIVQPILALGVQYVVFVGDDGIVPFRREPDETAISNERDYALDSFMRPGSPLFASIALGFNLTDDFYVDFDPIAWQGRRFYVPDLPSGRLVETPGEIRAAAQAFLASNGQLNPATGLVTGYDFFKDGADAMSATLSGHLPTTDLISDTWTSDNLRCELLGLPPCAPASVSALNAHFTHYAALSANGFDNITLDDFLASSEVPGSLLPAGAIVFSMGCHAGFNAPDRDSEAPDPGLGVDPALDFAQAMAIRRAIFVASTGFGLGDDAGIGGTEQLMALFAQDLTSGSAIVGSALIEAKLRYVNGLAAKTVYDEKSTIQTTLYGLPMYQVNVPPPVGPAPIAGGAPVSGSAVPSSLSLTVIDGAPTTTSVAYQEQTTSDGTVITADGLLSSTAARPRQPRVVRDVPPNSGDPVHGVILFGGGYADIANYDPSIARPQTEWEVGATEPQICLRSFWPSELANVNTLNTLNGLQQSVVFTPAQFRCDSASGDPVRGIERLYTSLTFELLRCASPDFVPPVVHSVGLESLSGGTVRATVDASDPSGIVRIVALRFSGGSIIPTSLNIPSGALAPYVIDVPDVGPDDLMVLLVQDGACNVTWATGKGAKLRAMIIDAGADKLYFPGAPTQFDVKVFNYASLAAPLYFEWDFGDGSVANGTLLPGDLTPDGLGNVTFSVQHTYSGVIAGAASVTVLDAGGAISVDGVAFACDGTSDADVDRLSVCQEMLLGTDAADADTDGDGCADGEEVLHPSHILGGQRDPLDLWDFYDVTGDRQIGLSDTLAILALFGDDGTSLIGNLADRFIPDQSQPWRTAEANNGVGLVDALANLRSFGDSCVGPP